MESLRIIAAKIAGAVWRWAGGEPLGDNIEQPMRRYGRGGHAAAPMVTSSGGCCSEGSSCPCKPGWLLDGTPPPKPDMVGTGKLNGLAPDA